MSKYEQLGERLVGVGAVDFSKELSRRSCRVLVSLQVWLNLKGDWETKNPLIK